MGQLVQAKGSAVAPGHAIGARGDEVPSQYLTFSLGGEMFGVGILNVKEIIEYGNLTEIPMMPAFIRGVINLRGSVVPVIDLAARFGGKSTEIGRRTCIVIVEVSDEDTRHDIGIIVDAVSEVLEIPGSEIEPPPSFGARIRADFIFGMGKVAGKFVILLEIAKVLSVEEIAMLTTADGGRSRLQSRRESAERIDRQALPAASCRQMGGNARRQWKAWTIASSVSRGSNASPGASTRAPGPSSPSVRCRRCSVPASPFASSIAKRGSVA